MAERITVPWVRSRKRRQGAEPLVMVTAYDEPWARLVDAAGVDLILVGDTLAELESASFRRMIEKAVAEYPNFKAVGTTLRHAKTASVNDWGAICYYEGAFHEAKPLPDLEIFDRVGGGDSFASGLIYGFLNEKGADWAVNCGCAHGALAMTTPGDTTMATFDEVQRLMEGGGARVQR